MNITPIDMQVVIPKATEVGKVQQTREFQDVLQQENGAAQFQQNVEHKLRQVQTTEKSEGKRIKEEEKKKKKQQQDDQRGGKQSQQEAAQGEVRFAVDVSRGRNIDIKL